VEPGEPLEDPAVLEAARAYAGDRFRQGLAAPDVALEFRLLHREVGRALRLHLADSTPTRDVVSAELLLNDGLDGAAYLALSSLGEHEAARHESEPDLASQPTFSWPENVVDRRAVERLAEALAERDLRERGRAGVPARILLDLDGTDDPAHGDQEGAASHGYARQPMCHPLLVFDGDSGRRGRRQGPPGWRGPLPGRLLAPGTPRRLQGREPAQRSEHALRRHLPDRRPAGRLRPLRRPRGRREPDQGRQERAAR